jgi:hypothetical protein
LEQCLSLPGFGTASIRVEPTDKTGIRPIS